MAEKVKSLPRFDDDRGVLFLFDIDSVNRNKIARLIKVYSGIQSIAVNKSSNAFLVCIYGNVCLTATNGMSEVIAENEYYQLSDDSFHLLSSADSIFIEVLLSTPTSQQINKTIRHSVEGYEISKKDNIIDLTDLVNRLDFETKRLFYIKNVPCGKTRGDHAHFYCSEIITALQGEFELIENDEITYSLNTEEPYKSYLIPNNVFTKESSFSKDAICLVLADTAYDPSGYHK